MKLTYSIYLILICFVTSSYAAEIHAAEEQTATEEQTAKALSTAVDKRAIAGQASRASSSAVENVTAAAQAARVSVSATENQGVTAQADRRTSRVPENLVPKNPVIEKQASMGKAALELKNYDQAIVNFNTGLSAAREEGDVQAETRFLFYSGLADQNAGEANGDELKLRSAVNQYQQVLVLKPDSGSTMVNLAQVYSRLDETDVAERLFQQAIQLDDERRPAYQTSYAGFLESQGRKEDARRLYSSLVQQDPFNQVAREALTGYYTAAATDWSQLKSYLWDLVRRGEVDQSLDVALAALANRTVSQESDAGLLTVIVASLSSKVGLAESFLESSTAKTLWGFATRPTIDAGIRELFSVYQALADIDGDSIGDYAELELNWWARGGAGKGTNPRDAMRQLLTSLGERYAYRKKYLIAELCYEKAFSFTPGDPDPAALRDIVNLYAQLGQVDKITKIAEKYEFVLFQSKGEAYRNSDLEKIYQYHRTLGQIYGYLAEKSGDWGNSNKSNSAIFQLEHAMDAGTELDRMQGDDPDQHAYHIDPGLVDRLATAYAETGSRTRSDDLRLKAARNYASAGDERAKIYVLKPLQIDQLTPNQIRQYRLLMPSG